MESQETSSIHAVHREAFRELSEQIKQMGLLSRGTASYIVRVCWVVGATGLGYAALLASPNIGIRILVCAVVGFSFVQAGGFSHEAAHGAVTANRSWARAIGQLFMSLFSGMSFSYWDHRHSKHHQAPNAREDPDVAGDVIPITQESVLAARGLRRLMAKNLHLVVFPLSTLMGLGLKIHSCRFLLSRPRQTRGDQSCMAVHYAIWFAPTVYVLGFSEALVNYALITWFSGMHLAVIFLTNHVGTETPREDGSQSELYCQIAASRNIKRSSWMVSSFFNGLDSHIEHHLFPTITYTKVHMARQPVRAMCQRLEIPYHEVSVFTAFREFYVHCRELAVFARQARHESSPMSTKISESVTRTGNPG